MCSRKIALQDCYTVIVLHQFYFQGYQAWQPSARQEWSHEAIRFWSLQASWLLLFGALKLWGDGWDKDQGVTCIK